MGRGRDWRWVGETLLEELEGTARHYSFPFPLFVHYLRYVSSPSSFLMVLRTCLIKMEEGGRSLVIVERKALSRYLCGCIWQVRQADIGVEGRYSV